VGEKVLRLEVLRVKDHSNVPSTPLKAITSTGPFISSTANWAYVLAFVREEERGKQSVL